MPDSALSSALTVEGMSVSKAVIALACGDSDFLDKEQMPVC